MKRAMLRTCRYSYCQVAELSVHKNVGGWNAASYEEPSVGSEDSSQISSVVCGRFLSIYGQYCRVLFHSLAV